MTTHKYAVDDVLHIPPSIGGVNYGTVLAPLDRGTYTGVIDASGDGPLYLINIGNVFGVGALYEYVLPESLLRPLLDSDRANEGATA